MDNEKTPSPFKTEGAPTTDTTSVAEGTLGIPTTETSASPLAVDTAPTTVVDDANHEHAAPSELSVLKSRAKLMGITFSNNISLEALKAKVAAKMAEDEPQTEPAPETKSDTDVEQVKTSEPQPTPGAVKPTPVQKLRMDLHNEQMKLVRVRITCMNPQKSDLHGEIITVANEYVGTVRKFVPFGEATDNGYHIPFILYSALEERRFQQIMTIKDPKTGHLRTRTKDAKEFAIDVLPPLTEKELQDLAVAQIAAGSIDANSDGEFLS